MGASGSIGTKALDSIAYLNDLYTKKHEEGKKFSVVGVCVKKNVQTLLRSYYRFSPQALVAVDPQACNRLRDEFKNNNLKSTTEIFSDLSVALQSVKYDILLNAVSGAAGLRWTAMAVKDGKKVLLANKESLVMAGELLCTQALESGSEIVPIDSEHSALLHLMQNKKREDVKKLILTASGGPFWSQKIDNPSIKQVLTHPNWSMGKKITVDSATMMNKGLEVIEAHHLFGFPYEDIEIIVHPQSIVHSLIETVDGEQYAQMSVPEMGYPIQNALTHPEIFSTPYAAFDLTRVGTLGFFPMDFKRFPLARLAYECGKKGKTWPTVLNAANEQVVHLFLAGMIDFSQIYPVVEQILDRHNDFSPDSVEQLIDLDQVIVSQVNFLHQAKI